MAQNLDTINLNDLPVVYYGPYSDIHQGPEYEGTRHAYKIIRVTSDTARALSRLNHIIDDLLTQQSQMDGVEHGHISPISAANANIAGMPVLSIKTPWYKNSNVLVYLHRNAGVDKTVLVTDVARALAVLHSIGIVHGNVHPDNVLITDDRRACVTDVGVYTSVVQATYINYLPVPSRWPYKSPEELLHGVRTFHTDVYSFACTVYSIYAERSPFKQSANTYARGIQQIIERGHSGILGNSKPVGMGDELWDLLGRCWVVNPAGRPTMMEVVEKLGTFASD